MRTIQLHQQVNGVPVDVHVLGAEADAVLAYPSEAGLLAFQGLLAAVK